MRKRFLGYFFILFLLLIGHSLFGQEDDYIHGMVVDQKTGEPVVFASVLLKGKARGVITNMDGGFRLPVRYREQGITIQVSSMGYEKKELPLKQLLLTSVNTIRLVPSLLELTEAVVSARKKREPTPRQIVRRAIANIPQNFPTNDFSTKGYYRDYQLDSLGYVNLNEALLEVFDAGFDEIDTMTTKVRIYDYSQNNNFRRDSLADDAYNYRDWKKIIDNAYLAAYGGNEFALLRVHDGVRNYKLNSFDFINTMNEGDILKNHSFKRLLDASSDREKLYTIQVKKVHPDYTARGTIYIAKNDYAIHKLQYAVYDDRKRNNDRLLQEKGIKGQLIFEVTTDYKRGLEDKMYLNYISFNNTFRLAQTPNFIVKDLSVESKKGVFVLHFNNSLATIDKAENDQWYEFKYKDKKINFEYIEIENDSTVVLHPAMSARSLNNMMGALQTMFNKRLDVGSVLKFRVMGLKDIHGNIINTWTYKDYNQFREYFVQEVDNLPQKPVDSLLMDKRKPIYEKQPIYRPDNFDEYWMNTPLKKTN